jgi:hypothetical protein
MAELKTKPTKKSVEAFLESIEPETRRRDGFGLLDMFKKATGQKPVMWGESIVGFGRYHYKSERSSQEGDWPLVAFSPRKQSLTLYLLTGGKNTYKDLLEKLGKHKTSVGCLYINKLSDVDPDILARLVERCFKDNKKMLT